MPASKSSVLAAKFDWRLLVTLAVMVASSLGLNAFSHGSPVTLRKGLAEFPKTLGAWTGVDIPITDDVQEILAATDLLSREYQDAQNQRSLGLFVAFFSSQKRGGAVHSPKNCLPGAGWSVVKGSIIPLTVPDRSEPILVNEYVIQKDQSKQVVLYWYQSQGRVIASEYSAKFYLVWDALRRNRTDGALVRIVAPVQNGNEQAALAQATAFVQASFPNLIEYIPN